MDSPKISIMKTISWRLIATLITTSIAFVITGKAAFAATIGIIDTLVKLGAYYLHERAWIRLRFGRKSVLKQQGVLMKQ